MTENKRIYYLDMLKIISAFMVTFYHFAFYRTDYGFIKGVFYYPNINIIIMSLCAMSIPLFFMVSGALMLTKDRSFKALFFKAIKIVFLIFIWKPLKCPVWLLKTLATLYILTPIIRKIYNNERKIYLYILMTLIFIMPFVYNYAIILLKFFVGGGTITLIGHTIDINTCERSGLFTMYSVLYYLLGAILYRRNLRKMHSLVLVVIGLCLVVIDTTMRTNYNNEIADCVNACFPTIGALLMGIGTFQLLKKLQYSSGIIHFSNAISAYVMSIYLLHIGVSVILFQYIFPVSEIHIFISLILSVLVDAICVGIGMCLSKIPYVRELIKI